jgi:pyruvate formate lyase activating enzyme
MRNSQTTGSDAICATISAPSPRIREGYAASGRIKKGVLQSLVYGRIVATGVDPIEKKPLFNFLPVTESFSVATAGCNFRCRWCQNWEISQLATRGIPGHDAAPEEMVGLAVQHDCMTMAYTYTEPTIFMEFALDMMKLAERAGIRNVFVTNGYTSEEALREVAPYLDAGKHRSQEFQRRDR